MGTAALFFTVGISTNTFNMFKVAIASLAVVLATPEADPHYYGLAAPVLYNAYPNWPGVSTPYSSSTCFGCRGKRSAEPGYYGYGPYFGGYHYGPGIAGHPGAATSYVARSPQGLRGKRSAEAGYIGYGPYFGGYHYGPGIAAHPGYATSYVTRSPQGLGKRSADAEADAAYVGHGFPHGSAAYAAYPVHHAPLYHHGYGYGLYH